MTLFKSVVGGAIVVCAVALSLFAEAQSVATVRSVDLSRYAGRWYEIAKFPNDFQRKCTGHVTADYRPLPDNTIEVANRCRTASGEIELAIGEGRVVDKAGNAKLQVRFAPAWMSWIPWVWGDYWILELDDAYTLATVGTPDRDYLWILARTPAIPDTEYERLLDDATKQGFDTSRLVKTKQ